MQKIRLRKLVCLLLFGLLCGCGAWQPTKNVWKSTKGFWNDYVSPPASVDYEQKGNLAPEARALATLMMGMDTELTALEKSMQNADKPPTQQWLDNLFAKFPWLSGFAGVKYDGKILGQQPPDSLKELDFNYLLYEDAKQNSRALRADVQPGPLGPEIMLASPLFDGADFLGIVVAYFDMRSLIKYSQNPEDLVVLCPTALLWPGKYEFAATPLAGVDWAKVARESSAGTCSNSHGKFFYLVRFLGNLPLIFAIPESGDFPPGDGSLEQGAAFFPQSREKMAPPPAPERKEKNRVEPDEFGRDEYAAPAPEPGAEVPPESEAQIAPAPDNRPSPNEIQPGSRDSVLLKGGGARKREIQERDLEGENVPVERVPRQRKPAPRPLPIPDIEFEPEPEPMPLPEPTIPTLPGGRPSPFGPREDTTTQPAETPAATTAPAGETSSATPAPEREPASPAPETPAPETKAEPEKPAEETPPTVSPTPPATLPGGRPSPFGPRTE